MKRHRLSGKTRFLEKCQLMQPGCQRNKEIWLSASMDKLAFQAEKLALWLAFLRTKRGRKLALTTCKLALWLSVPTSVHAGSGGGSDGFAGEERVFGQPKLLSPLRHRIRPTLRFVRNSGRDRTKESRSIAGLAKGPLQRLHTGFPRVLAHGRACRRGVPETLW